MHIRIFIHLYIDILQGFYPFTHKKAIFSTIILKDRNPLFIKLLVSDPLEIFWVSWSLSAVIFFTLSETFSMHCWNGVCLFGFLSFGFGSKQSPSKRAEFTGYSQHLHNDSQGAVFSLWDFVPWKRIRMAWKKWGYLTDGGQISLLDSNLLILEKRKHEDSRILFHSLILFVNWLFWGPMSSKWNSIL